MGSTKVKKIVDMPVDVFDREAQTESEAAVEAVEETVEELKEAESEIAKIEGKAVIFSSPSDLRVEDLSGHIDSSEVSQNDSKNGTGKDKSEKKSKRAVKKGQLKYRSKKYQASAEQIEKTQLYPLEEAVTLAQKVSYSKNPATLEIHINTAMKNIRGLASLPFAAGKKLRIVAFGQDAADSGADMVGDEAKLSEIMKSKIDFDVLVTTPEWMPRLAPAARVLGPRGLMPNPKNGTITDNLAKAVSELQSGKVEYKTEKDNKVIHLSIGKTDQSAEEIVTNIRTLFTTVGKSKIKKMTLSPSMGPGVKVNMSSI